MKQVLQDMQSDRPHLADVPVPTPPPGFALVRTAASVVSAGTERMLVEFAGKSLLAKARSRPDLLRQALDKARREGPLSALGTALGRLKEPMPLGYSSAGVIVELGENMQGFRVGQRVACAGGGYAVHAEYALVPRLLLAPLPDDMAFEDAAFGTLGAIAMHGFRLTGLSLGESVAIIGLGVVGQLAAGIAAAAGCHVLGIDLDPARIKLARKRGIRAVSREKAEETAVAFTHNQGFDAVSICAASESNDAIELAAGLARDRAKVVSVGAVGLNVPRRAYYAKELPLVVSRAYGPGRGDPLHEEIGVDYPIGYVRWTEGRNLAAFVDLLSNGAVEVQSLISHRFPIDSALGAYDLIRGSEPFLGVLITYPDTPPPPRKAFEFHAPPSAKKDKVRLGVLGAGNFARSTMLPAVHRLPGLELVGIASTSGRPAADLAKRYSFAYATSEEGRILEDPNIDAVAILTRHHLHAGQVLSALKAGKAVFCEKPLALNEKELSSVETALSRRGAPLLAMGFNRRFAPPADDMLAFIRSTGQLLTAHYRVNAGALPADHWLRDPEQGGGRLVGEACHFIDFLTFLVGAPPQSVFAQALPADGAAGEDSFQLQLRFPDGSLASLSYWANGDRALAKEHLEVFSAGRVARLEDFRKLHLTFEGRTRRLSNRQDKGHRAAWQAFLAAMTEGGAPPIPYEHLFAVARTTFAAQKSLRTGIPENI